MNTICSTFIILIFCISLSGCKKDNAPAPSCTEVVEDFTEADTIYPSDYLMTYPGSYWKYSGDYAGTTYSETDTCLGWKTVSMTTIGSLNECTGIFKNYKIIPHTNYAVIAGWDSFFAGETDNDSCRLMQLIDTTPGVFYYGTFGKTTSGAVKIYKNECIEKIPSMTVAGVVYNDVIHIKAFYQEYFYHISNGPSWTYHHYYAKNVGKIRTEITTNQGPLTTPSVWELVDYYIAPH